MSNLLELVLLLLLKVLFGGQVESLTAARNACQAGTEPSDAIRVVNSVLTQLDQIKRLVNKQSMLYVHAIIEKLISLIQSCDSNRKSICQTFMCVELFLFWVFIFLDLVFQTFQRCDPNNVKCDRKDRLGVCGQS